MALAEKHNLAVIEDAAHAPGATLNGRALGTFGAVGCYSFFSNKNLPTGEGGMLVTDRDDLAEKLRLLRSHGMTSLTYDRHQGHAFSYDVVALGYNHRIDEIRSALGLAQLAKLADNNAQRRPWTHAYWDALADLPVDLPFKPPTRGRLPTTSSPCCCPRAPTARPS
jgi:dTDP-4-amino-4,6-dideoxygalactose transaminase